MTTTIVSNSTAATFGNSPQKTGEPIDRLSIYSGKGLEFDGVSDYITSDPDFLVNASRTTAMTVAVWVNVDDISSNQDVIAALDTGTSCRFLGNYNGSILFTMYNSSDYSDILGQKTDDVVLVEGQWHRIVATYDGSQTDAGFKIYMDGALIASSASDNIFSTSLTTNLTIGRTNRSSGDVNDFAGKMSDFQVWDTVWSLADVTYDYLNPEKLITSNASVSGSQTTSNLRVWYPMNDTGLTNPQTVIFDGANTGGLQTNLVTSAGTEASWGTLSNGTLTNTSATGFTFTSTSDGSENAYLSAAGLLSEDLSVGIYKISLDVTQTTPFGDEQSIRWYKTGSSAETLSLTAGSNVFYRPIDTANNNSQLFFNASAIGNDITVSNFSIQKVKQGFHGTTTFFGDDKLGGNGNFDATSNWSVVSGSVGTEWTINDSSNSKAVHNTSNANTLRYTGSSGDLVNGTTYQVDFTIADRTAGSLTFALGGGSAGSSQTASGSIELTAGGTSNRIIDINPTSDFDGSIDSVTVKEVGIATGWTDADQQQYIPQTAFMDGCVKSIFNYPTIDDEYVDLNYGNAYNPYDNGLTISFWAFPFVITGNQMAISAPWSGDTRAYIGLGGDSKWGLGVQGKSWSSAVATGSEPSATVNAWVFISVTFNAGTATLYHNGSAAFTQTYTSFAFNSDFYLGSGTSSSYEFQGILDDVSIFSSSLSESEVQELYNNGLPLNATKHSVYIADNTKLKGYWKNNKLESTGKWEDLSNNNNHGEHNNSENVYIFFQQGVTANLCTQGYSNNIVQPSKGAAYFDGVNSYGNAGSGITIDDIWRSSATVEFWIKPFTATASDRVLDKKPSGTDGWYISLEDVSGAACDIQLRCDATTSDSIQITASREIALHQWNYVAIVYDGSAVSNTATIYVGGGSSNAEPTSKTVTSTNPGAVPLLTDAGNDLAIGGRSGTETDNSFDGFIDDVKIYDKALSLTELTKNFKNNKSQHKN